MYIQVNISALYIYISIYMHVHTYIHTPSLAQRNPMKCFQCNTLQRTATNSTHCNTPLAHRVRTTCKIGGMARVDASGRQRSEASMCALMSRGMRAYSSHTHRPHASTGYLHTCVYVCISVHTYVYMFMYTYTYIYIYELHTSPTSCHRVCTHLCVRVCAYIHTYTYIYTYIYIYVYESLTSPICFQGVFTDLCERLCVCVCVCVCVYICIYIHVYTYTYI